MNWSTNFATAQKMQYTILDEEEDTRRTSALVTTVGE